MPIQFGSRLRSAIANATFFDKTQDDTTVGKLNMANTDTASGDPVNNAQREINISKALVSPATTLGNAAQIATNELSRLQVYRVAGDSAPVVLNTIVFSSQPIDGAEIIIIGQDDTNTVTINFNDSQNGQYINGNATLKRGYVLRLIWDSGLERFIEIGRNF